MNENLAKLKALIAETNEVVANLNKETNNIRQSNQDERVHKFAAIRDYLLDCYEVVKDLHERIMIKIDVPNVTFIDYTMETFIVFQDNCSQPIFTKCKYRDSSDCFRSLDGKIITSDTVWRKDNAKQYLFPSCFTQQNEFDFVDLWDKETFEKRFATEVEKIITKKARQANDQYDYEVNKKAILKGE